MSIYSPLTQLSGLHMLLEDTYESDFFLPAVSANRIPRPPPPRDPPVRAPRPTLPRPSPTQPLITRSGSGARSNPVVRLKELGERFFQWIRLEFSKFTGVPKTIMGRASVIFAAGVATVFFLRHRPRSAGESRYKRIAVAASGVMGFGTIVAAFIPVDHLPPVVLCLYAASYGVGGALGCLLW